MSIQCQQQSHLERLFGADPMCAVLGEREVLPRLDDLFLALVADHALAIASPGAACSLKPVPAAKLINTNFNFGSLMMSLLTMRPSA